MFDDMYIPVSNVNTGGAGCWVRDDMYMTVSNVNTWGMGCGMICAL